MAMSDILYTVQRTADMDLVHPVAREAFKLLEYDLTLMHSHGTIHTWFRPFETYRHPARQREALRNKTSRAGMYDSAHQFGLAVDFVAWSNGRWSWDPKLPWDVLRAAATKRGLINELSWDRAHVEHPYWQDLRGCLKTI